MAARNREFDLQSALGTLDRQGEPDDRLRIELLGSPRIAWHMKTLTISRRQVRALLYRLAATLEPVSREQICALIWPDQPPSKARRSLTHLLTHLRQALPDPDLVDFQNDYILLNPERVFCDSLLLDQVFSERHKLLAGSVEPVSPGLELLEIVAKSYRGPFLSGFGLSSSKEFEQWVDQERQYYQYRYLEILSDLIDSYYHRKFFDRAIAFAKSYLDIDNLAEEVHCRLIELYASIGDRGAAERQFEACATILEQELGISPSPKTWAIFQSATGSHSPGMMLSPAGLADRAFNGPDTPLTGRQELLDVIDQAYELAISGRSQFVLIQGGQGMGKTRLLQHFASTYHNRSTVLYYACRQGLENLPFHPIAESLRPVIETQAISVKISPVWLSEAARLLPEIYTRLPDLPPPLATRPEESRLRLFEALFQMISGLQSRFRPLLMLFDDLHWADSATIEWLIYVTNRLATDGLGHFLIVGSYRTEEGQVLAELRSVLSRMGQLKEHLLSELGQEDVEQILLHYLGRQEHSSSLAARLVEISGGNPFFLIETLQAFIESHMQPDQSFRLDRLSLPATIQEAIHQYLQPVTAIERKLLEVMAVLDHALPIDMAKDLLTADEQEILMSLDSLVSRGFLKEIGGTYRFSYDLLNLVIYRDIGYGQRRYLHRHCANLLEKHFPAELGLLAWQFEQSGEPGKAADYAMQAGEQSIQKSATRDALDFFSRALVSLKEQAASLNSNEEVTANYRKQIQVLSRRSSLFRSLGEMAAFQDDLAEEAHLASSLGDLNSLARVYLHEANAHRWFCRYHQAQASAEKALQIGVEIGDACIQARARFELGLALRAAGDFTAAESNLQQALQLFRNLNETSYEIYTLGNLSTLYTYQGDTSNAEKYAYLALDRCEQAKLPNLRRVALGDLGVALASSQYIEQARECLLSSLDLAHEIADRTQEIFCLCQLGWLENQANRPEQALKYLRDGLALSESLDSRSEQSRLYAGLAEAHRAQGNLRLAKSFAAKALLLAERHGRHYDQTLAEQILAKMGENL